MGTSLPSSPQGFQRMEPDLSLWEPTPGSPLPAHPVLLTLLRDPRWRLEGRPFSRTSRSCWALWGRGGGHTSCICREKGSPPPAPLILSQRVVRGCRKRGKVSQPAPGSLWHLSPDSQVCITSGNWAQCPGPGPAASGGRPGCRTTPAAACTPGPPDAGSPGLSHTAHEGLLARAR